MANFLDKIIGMIEKTKISEQISDVDIVALFTNPWFLVPFVVFVVYLIYKTEWKTIIIVAVFIGLWWSSGTEYMNALVVDGELQPKKIFPVVFGGAAILGFIIYIFFGRSD